MHLKWARTREVDYLHVPEWTSSGTKHAFLGNSVDSRKDAERCDEIASAICGIPSQNVLRLKQIHSPEIVSELRPEGMTEADGWYLDERASPGIYGIETADCAPVLIRGGTSVAALHCGWRGSCERILGNAIDLFLASGIDPETLEIAIGPCAGVCCYEVGQDFVDGLRPRWGETGLERRNGKFYFDLKALLSFQALARGVRKGALITAQECTICDHRFFSFRRQKLHAGRQLTFICSNSVC